MAEATAAGDRTEGTPVAGAGELSPAELEQLAELVYRLLREDVMRMRERRGEVAARP